MSRLLFLATLVLLVSRPAHAYLDPGTGSILVQALLAGLAALSAVVAAFWSRIRRIVSWRPGSQPSVNRDETDS